MEIVIWTVLETCFEVCCRLLKRMNRPQKSGFSLVFTHIWDHLGMVFNIRAMGLAIWLWIKSLVHW